MRMTTPLLLLALGLPAAQPHAGEADKPRPAQASEAKPITRIYDLSALLQSGTDFPGPELLPAGNPNEPAIAPPFSTAPAQVLTVASVADTIRQRVAPERWDPALGTSLEERAGRLVITQFPDVLEKIDALLEALSKKNHRTVCIQALLVAPTKAQQVDYLGRAGKQVPQASVDALLKDGKLLAMPQLLALDGARAHLFSGTALSYVAGAEDSAHRAEPVVAQAFGGVAMDVRAKLNDDASAAELDLRLAETGKATASPGTQVAAEAPKEEDQDKEDKAEPLVEPGLSQSGKSKAYRTQTVSVQGRATQQTLQAPVGKWVLASILARPGPETPGENGQALLLVMITLP